MELADSLLLLGGRAGGGFSGGLRIFSAENPAGLRLLGSWLDSAQVQDIAVQAPSANLATDSGLVIIDITDPASPRQVGTYSTVHPLFLPLLGRQNRTT